jgi:orotidine-5'-phosphate decarboxylase
MHRKKIMSSRVIVALDYADQTLLMGLVDQLTPEQCRLKVGKQVFTRFGPQLVRELVDRGFDVFLDLKFHDIPNTVASACEAAAELGVWMLNVHALGGTAMMQAARAALSDANSPLLIAVTLLTSSGPQELDALGIDESPAELVLRLAKMAQVAGLDGVVSSAQEVAAIKSATSGDFITVTPGIRPAGSAAQDQQRIMTPTAAIEQGADYLVIGRPVTQADDPCRILRTINSEIS